nr:terminase small subunit [Candidatus Brocadiales bacterium]
GTYDKNNIKILMLGANGIPPNIYSFSKNLHYREFGEQGNKLRGGETREFLFAMYIAKGEGVADAYMKAYTTKNPTYAEFKGVQMLKKEKIKKMVKEEIQKILNDEGVTHTYLIQRYKQIADLADRDNDKLKALGDLSKISGLFDTDKKSESVQIWAGFSPEQLEAIKNDGKTKLLGEITRTE